MIQLILLISILFFFFVFGLGYGLVPRIMDVDLSELVKIDASTPVKVINAAFVLQVLFSISVFLLSSLLFAYFTHPRPAGYLGLRKPGKPVQWVLVLFLMVGAIPIILQIGNWMKLIDFGPEVAAQQKAYEASLETMLRMSGVGSFAKVLLIMAVLPAIGEELLFRGVFMRFAARRSRSVVFPILLSSVMFALVHNNIYGLPAIFLAGALLGTIYYLTGSLYLSILGHFLNNGLQVILLYIGSSGSASVKGMIANDQLPPYVTVAGALVFAVSLYLLIRNRTPMPLSWADDYTEQELSEKAV